MEQQRCGTEAQRGNGGFSVHRHYTVSGQAIDSCIASEKEEAETGQANMPLSLCVPPFVATAASGVTGVVGRSSCAENRNSSGWMCIGYTLCIGQ